MQPYLTRRRVLAGTAAALAMPHVARAALRKVRIAVGTNVLNISYPWLTLPLIHTWRDAGYDVEVLPVGASLQAMQQMVAGNVEFAQLDSPVVVQANVINNLPARVVMDTGVNDWGIGVAADGPIRSVGDLKGKRVGVFSLATGGITYLKADLHTLGLDTQRDVHLIAIGLGAPAVQAFRDQRVDALLYWGSALAGFENAGLRLRYIQDQSWMQYPDFMLSAMQPTITADPAMVEAIARGCAMASVFVMANPDCQRQLHWRAYPATRPANVPEATATAWDMNSLNRQLDTMRAAFTLNGGRYWGAATPGPYDRLQHFMQANGLVPRTIDPATYMITIPDFYARINDFDAAAVAASARACTP